MNFGVQYFCNSMCKTGFEISFVFILLPIYGCLYLMGPWSKIYIYFLWVFAKPLEFHSEINTTFYIAFITFNGGFQFIIIE